MRARCWSSLTRPAFFRGSMSRPRGASPTGPSPEVAAHNPLGKIPALVLEDGTALYDSRVICEYLDGLSTGTRLFPDGPARWDALTRQALADGLLDAALLTRYERALRPEAPALGGMAGWADRKDHGGARSHRDACRRHAGTGHRHRGDRLRAGLPRLPLSRSRLAGWAGRPRPPGTRCSKAARR